MLLFQAFLSDVDTMFRRRWRYVGLLLRTEEYVCEAASILGARTRRVCGATHRDYEARSPSAQRFSNLGYGSW